MSKSDLTDIEVKLHGETAAAYRVSLTGEIKEAVWVPKSQCEFYPSKNHRWVGQLTLPEWLAIEKGLV